MPGKFLTLTAVAAASAALTTGVALAQGDDAPQPSAGAPAQGMSGGSMREMGGAAMGRAMTGRAAEADVTAMAEGMGMKLDAASVGRMVRGHNAMMGATGAMGDLGATKPGR